jgi:hypothetical protein
MVGMATENNLGYLVSLAMVKPQKLVLLQTDMARQRHFGKHLAEYCQSNRIELVFKQLKDGSSVSAVLNELGQIAGEAEPSVTFVCNLAGGLKLHSVALWEFFRQQLRLTRVVFANLQENTLLEWALKEEQLQESRQTLGEISSLQGVLHLYGFRLKAHKFNPGDIAANIRRIDQLRNEAFNTGQDKGAGLRFEWWCADRLVRLMAGRKLQTVRALYVGAKIIRGDASEDEATTHAEYDLVLETKDNRFVLIECKTSNKLTLKTVKAQKQLSAEWGGAFSAFALVMPIEFEGLDASERIRAMARHGVANRFTVFYGPNRPRPDIRQAFPLDQIGEVLKLNDLRESTAQ